MTASLRFPVFCISSPATAYCGFLCLRSWCQGGVVNRPESMGKTPSRRTNGEYGKLRHGSSSPRTGRSFDPERAGGASEPPVHDEHDRRSGLLSKRILCLSDRARTFSECESDSGIGAGVEADAEMEMIPEIINRSPCRNTCLVVSGT
jgi:hypothetical protein